MQRRPGLLSILVMAAALLAGCGSGAVSPPDDDGPTSTNTTTGGTTPGGGKPPEEEYEFGLPVGDPSVQTYEFALYEDLRTGDCDAAARSLNGDGDERPWRNLTSQRDVLLFQAGIDLCRGDRSSAVSWFGQLRGDQLSGLDSTKNLCQLYRASASVLRGVPPEDVDCPGGTVPGWPDGDDFTRRDDPRTAADEGAVPPSPPPGEGESPEVGPSGTAA